MADGRASGAAAPRIGVDGYNLGLAEGTGVATYARNLTRALKRLGAEVDVVYGQNLGWERDPLLREVQLFDPSNPPRRKPFSLARLYASAPLAATVGLPARPVPVTGRVVLAGREDRLPAFDRIWNVERLFAFAIAYFRVTGRLARVRMPDPPAVMHWTYPVPAELLGALNIYTLHDLVPLRLPYTTLDTKAQYLRLGRALARRADALVTVSEASRRDIVDLLQVAPERVVNTYQSVEVEGREPSPAELAAVVRAGAGVEVGGYHLFLGAVEPKKNVGRLLEAYHASGVETPLLLVGKAAWSAEAELRLAGEGGRVLRLPHVDRTLLVNLIRGARALVFPSLYEGFGLPVAEAMALGAPVVTSNTSSLPEVAGDAALQVDPYDVAALAAAIRRIDGDAVLRAELSARGRVQARRFSAEAYDARLRALYGGLGVGL